MQQQQQQHHSQCLMLEQTLFPMFQYADKDLQRELMVSSYQKTDQTPSFQTSNSMKVSPLRCLFNPKERKKTTYFHLQDSLRGSLYLGPSSAGFFFLERVHRIPDVQLGSEVRGLPQCRSALRPPVPTRRCHHDATGPVPVTQARRMAGQSRCSDFKFPSHLTRTVQPVPFLERDFLARGPGPAADSDEPSTLPPRLTQWHAAPAAQARRARQVATFKFDRAPDPDFKLKACAMLRAEDHSRALAAQPRYDRARLRGATVGRVS
jgi:hypothetical protein